MDQSSQQLIDYLRSIHAHKTDLNNHLNADCVRDFVYFIAPLSNISLMQQSGRILPRNIAGNFHDLSDQSIQSMRERTVNLRNSTGARQALVHDCVNLFFNPLNKTYYAYRRNARIRAYPDDPSTSVVGILELDLAAILDIEGVYWYVSDGNLAGFNGQNGNYQRMAWPYIYSIHYGRDGNDSYRAAEFLAFLPTGEGIPFECVNRVLALPQDAGRLNGHISENLDITRINNDQRVFVFGDELHYDRQFWQDEQRIINVIIEQFQLDIRGIFERSLLYIARMEGEFGLSLRESFINQEIASSDIHGVAHVLRVMFWIHVLAEICSYYCVPLTAHELKAAMYAGFFHDSCRENNNEDEDHGKAAAERYREFIRREIVYPDSNRCLAAIEAHSKNTDPNQDDIVWKIVKDADALDRGRFGTPDSGNGCNRAMLRLGFFSNDNELAGDILWAAYFLPKITKYMKWTEHSCQDFVNTITASRNCVNNARTN